MVVGVTTAPVAGATEIEPGYVRQRAAALVRDGKGARMLVLRALPRWSGEPTLQVDGRTVHVRPGVSQLAILDAYADLPPGDYTVTLAIFLDGNTIEPSTRTLRIRRVGTSGSPG